MLEELAHKIESPALRAPEPLYQNEEERVDDEPDQQEEQHRPEQIDSPAAGHSAARGKR